MTTPEQTSVTQFFTGQRPRGANRIENGPKDSKPDGASSMKASTSDCTTSVGGKDSQLSIRDFFPCQEKPLTKSRKIPPAANQAAITDFFQPQKKPIAAQLAASRDGLHPIGTTTARKLQFGNATPAVVIPKNHQHKICKNLDDLLKEQSQLEPAFFEDASELQATTYGTSPSKRRHGDSSSACESPRKIKAPEVKLLEQVSDDEAIVSPVQEKFPKGLMLPKSYVVRAAGVTCYEVAHARTTRVGTSSNKLMMLLLLFTYRA